MKLKSEKSNTENENYTLRQEIESKNKEIKNNYDLYKSLKNEHESFLQHVINSFFLKLIFFLLFS